MNRRKLQRWLHTYRGGGAAVALKQIVRELLAPLYQRETRYVLLRSIPNSCPNNFPHEDATLDGECLVVQDVAELKAVAHEIPSTLFHSLKDFENRLARGCVVFLAFRPHRNDTGREFVGYSIDQRGVLAVLGHERSIPPDILFVHYREMLPQFRGTKFNALAVVREKYCQQNGIKMLCTVVAPYNRAALRYTTSRSGYSIVSTFTQTSILRGWVTWHTPWVKIEETLRQFRPHA